MSNLRQDLETAVRRHRAKLAAHEVHEDFPLLRLNKSIHAARFIATFQSLPPAQRMEVALALVGMVPGVPESDHSRRLRQAFHLRMSKRTLDELESLSASPTPLDLDLDEDRYRELQGADIWNTLIRHDEKSLGRAEIRKCFLARFKAAGAGEFLPAKRGGEKYELTETVSGWDLATRLEFGGEPLNQFFFAFQLKHPQMEGHQRFSLGGLLGLGELRWNDLHRETLDQDAPKAVQLWTALRNILIEIINEQSRSNF